MVKAINSLKFLLLLILPLLLLATALRLCESRGPFYLQVNSDPCYPYLINSLNIALINPINQVDNPGISVVVIGGITIRGVALFKGVDDLEDDVIRYPEFYLEIINRVFIGMNVLALFLLGFFALKWTGSLFAASFLQCAPFISDITLVRLTKVSPEPILMLTCIILMLALLWVIFKDPQLKKANRLTWVFAFIIAFGLCTKLTFVPFAVIPLFVLPRVKRKLAYLALTLVFFHLFFIPGMLHYNFFLNWITNVLTHRETYGNGPAGFADPQAFKAALQAIFKFEYLPYLIMLFAVVASTVLDAIKKLRKLPETSLESKIIFALALAALGQLILTAKHFQFYPFHYLIPTMVLAVFMLYLTIRLIANVFQAQQWVNARILKGLQLLCFLLLLLYLPAHIRYINLPEVFDYLEKDKNDYRALEDFIENNYAGYAKLFVGPVSSPYYAIKHGGSYQFLPPQNFFPTMEKIYLEEKVYFYNNTIHQFLTWTGTTDLKSITEKNDSIILQGLNGELPMKEAKLFTKVYEGGNESVYVLKKDISIL